MTGVKTYRDGHALLRAAVPVVMPSILQCDFAVLGEEIGRLEAADVRAIHLDVMDGQFVPNLSFGMPVIQSIRNQTERILDVHLMIERPERHLHRFREVGADAITIHIETVPDPRQAIDEIHRLGAMAGLSLNPGTDLEKILPYAHLCEIVLVMSVEPGFGGQSFNRVALDKLQQLRDWRGIYHSQRERQRNRLPVIASRWRCQSRDDCRLCYRRSRPPGCRFRGYECIQLS